MSEVFNMTTHDEKAQLHLLCLFSPSLNTMFTFFRVMDASFLVHQKKLRNPQRYHHLCEETGNSALNITGTIKLNSKSKFWGFRGSKMKHFFYNNFAKSAVRKAGC